MIINKKSQDENFGDELLQKLRRIRDLEVENQSVSSDRILDYVENRFKNLYNDEEILLKKETLDLLKSIYSRFETIMVVDGEISDNKEKRYVLSNYLLTLYTQINIFQYLKLHLLENKNILIFDDGDISSYIMSILCDSYNHNATIVITQDYYSKQLYDKHKLINSEIISEGDLIFSVYNKNIFYIKLFGEFFKNVKYIEWDYEELYRISFNLSETYENKIKCIDKHVKTLGTGYDFAIIDNSNIHFGPTGINMDYIEDINGVMRLQNFEVGMNKPEVLEYFIRSVMKYNLKINGYIFGDFMPSFDEFDGYGFKLARDNGIDMFDVIPTHVSTQWELSDETGDGKYRYSVDLKKPILMYHKFFMIQNNFHNI